MRIRHLLLSLLLALTALFGVLPASSPAQALTVAHVRIQDMAFSPANLTVVRGRTVTWTNRDPFAHSIVVTSGPRLFHSRLLQPGQSFSHTFGVRGLYRYKCGVHPMMRGTVRVR